MTHEMTDKTIEGKHYQECSKCGCTFFAFSWWVEGYQSLDEPACGMISPEWLAGAKLSKEYWVQND